MVQNKIIANETLIVTHVCKLLHIDNVDDVVNNKCRKQEFVFARQVSMVMILLFTTQKHKPLSMFFHMKHHTSIIHAKKTIANWIDTDEIVFLQIASIFRNLNELYKVSKKSKRNEIEIYILQKLQNFNTIR